MELSHSELLEGKERKKKCDRHRDNGDKGDGDILDCSGQK